MRARIFAKVFISNQRVLAWSSVLDFSLNARVKFDKFGLPCGQSLGRFR